MNSRTDLVAEAIAGACAAVAVALVMDRVDPVKNAADKVPRLGWKADDDGPPMLAHLLGTLVATVVFRSTFSVTRGLARKMVSHAPTESGPARMLRPLQEKLGRGAIERKSASNAVAA